MVKCSAGSTQTCLIINLREQSCNVFFMNTFFVYINELKDGGVSFIYRVLLIHSLSVNE